MMKKLLILLVAVLVVALLTIIPVALRSRFDASSAMMERDSTPEVHHPQLGQTPTIAETVTAPAGTTPTGTVAPSPTSPTPALSPTSSLHQGIATVYLQ